MGGGTEITAADTRVPGTLTIQTDFCSYFYLFYFYLLPEQIKGVIITFTNCLAQRRALLPARRVPLPQLPPLGFVLGTVTALFTDFYHCKIVSFVWSMTWRLLIMLC